MFVDCFSNNGHVLSTSNSSTYFAQSPLRSGQYTDIRLSESIHKSGADSGFFFFFFFFGGGGGAQKINFWQGSMARLRALEALGLL